MKFSNALEAGWECPWKKLAKKGQAVEPSLVMRLAERPRFCLVECDGLAFVEAD
jgi:hypothetical protein